MKVGDCYTINKWLRTANRIVKITKIDHLVHYTYVVYNSNSMIFKTTEHNFLLSFTYSEDITNSEIIREIIE